MRKWFKQTLSLCVSLSMVLYTLAPVIFGISTTAMANNGLSVQTITEDGVTAIQMAQNILGDGVQARKKGGGALDATAFKGSGLSAGLFTNGAAALGVDSGIILSTGLAKNVMADGQNGRTNASFQASTANGSAGDADLKTLGPGGNTFDASVLEFDFQLPDPAADTVEFQFVMASEEYPEYISNFFDIMGLYINGQNVAKVPGTTQAVSIGTVNHVSNSDYYISNSASTKETTMDGLTIVLTATATINPGTWNTIKLAIADYGDSVYDSNVFIQSNSLRAPSNIKYSNVTGTGFAITWSPVEDVNTYDLYLRRDGVDTFIGTSTRLSYTFSGLLEYTDYAVVIKSRNSEGDQSPASPPITVKTRDVTPPDTPTDVEMDARTATTIGLKWTASTDNQSGIKGYAVYKDNVKVTETAANVTSYQFTGLTQNTLYGLSVAAVDVAGNFSKRVTVTEKTLDNELPSQPKINVPVLSKSRTNVTISWTAATDNDKIAGYRVYKDLPGGADPTADYQNTVCGTTKSLACEFTGLTKNTHYVFTVVAVDETGNLSTIDRIENRSTQTQSTDAYNNEVTVKTLSDEEVTDVTPPTQPGSISFSATTMTGFTASWTASTDADSGVAGYDVSIKEGAGTFQKQTTTASTSYTFSNLKNNTTYTVRVTAIDNDGNTSTNRDASNKTVRDSTPPTLANPHGLAATNKTETSFTLTWNAGTTDNIELDGYEIYQNGKSIGFTDVLFFDVNQNLELGKTYSMTIKAKDKAGNYSGATTPPLLVKMEDVTPPLIPLDLEAANILTTQLELGWADSTDNLAVTGYEVYQYNNATSQYVKNGETAETTYTVTGLVKDTTYKFAVKAKDAASNVSEFSEPLEVKTALNSEPPSAPGALFAEGLSEDKFLLTWETSEDDIAVKEYEIYYAVYNDSNEDDGFDIETSTEPKTSLLNKANFMVEKRVVRTSEASRDFLSTIIGDGKNTDDLNSANADDVTLVPDKTYLIYVRAVDSDGNKSAAPAEDPFDEQKLPFLLEANTGPVVTVTRAKGDLTRTNVVTNYTIGKTVLHPAMASTAVTKANIKCILRDAKGVVVASFFPKTTNPSTTFKRLNANIGANRCLLNVEKSNVGTMAIKDGTYYMLLVVEHPTATVPGSNPPKLLKTKILRTIKVDKTAPVIKDVMKTNDLYGPDGKSLTTIRYRVDDDGYHAVKIFNKEGLLVRTLSKKTKLTGCRDNFKDTTNPSYNTLCPYIEWSWNGKNKRNVDVPDGTYTINIRVTNLVRTFTENIKSYKAEVSKTNADGSVTVTPAVQGNTLSINVENKSPSFTKTGIAPAVLLRKGAVSAAGRYTLSEKAYVKVEALDKDSNQVKLLRDQITVKDPKKVTAAGLNTFTWDGKNNAGTPVPDGVYTIRITAVDIPPAKVATECTLATTGQWPSCAENTSYDSKTTVYDLKMQLDGVSSSLAFNSITAKTSGEAVNVVDKDTTVLALTADGTNKVEIKYTLPEYARVQTVILKNGATYRTIERSSRDGNTEYTVGWNGKSATGVTSTGTHIIKITATDPSGKEVIKEFTLNVSAP